MIPRNNVEFQNTSSVAKELEKHSDWIGAAEIWRSLGRTQDYESCMLIARSIERGDAYRDAVQVELGAEPNPATHPNSYMKWHKKLQEIYNRYYK